MSQSRTQPCSLMMSLGNKHAHCLVSASASSADTEELWASVRNQKHPVRLVT